MAGAGFEVGFEFSGKGLSFECDIDLDLPGLEFGGVGVFAVLESFFCKSPAGWAFQVVFKIQGTLSVSKSQSGFDPPRFKFRGMRTLPIIVVVQAIFEIFGETGVKP